MWGHAGLNVLLLVGVMASLIGATLAFVSLDLNDLRFAPDGTAHRKIITEPRLTFGRAIREPGVVLASRAASSIEGVAQGSRVHLRFAEPVRCCCAAGRPWWERRHLWEIVTFFCYRITELGARITLLGLFAVSFCPPSPHCIRRKPNTSA